MAADVQAPLGSRESFRGLANLGLMAAPAVGELLGEAALAGRAKPPIQARTVTEAPITPEPTAPEPQPVPEAVAPVTAEPIQKTAEVLGFHLYGKNEWFPLLMRRLYYRKIHPYK